MPPLQGHELAFQIGNLEGAFGQVIAALISPFAGWPGRGRVCLGGTVGIGYTSVMTRALNAAIAKLATLPAEEQDRLAQWLLDELRDEDQWTQRFATSQNALSKLAAEVRADRAQGKATILDPDKL